MAARICGTRAQVCRLAGAQARSATFLLAPGRGPRSHERKCHRPWAPTRPPLPLTALILGDWDTGCQHGVILGTQQAAPLRQSRIPRDHAGLLDVVKPACCQPVGSDAEINSRTAALC
eukprot:XP_001694324.1 predicted protein [Chlamydomonas reinhardtii]